MGENSHEHEEQELRRFVAAFADGELDVSDNLRLLEHMAMHPQTTRRVMHQQQLRQLVQWSMRDAAPAPPEYLRRAILERLDAASAAPGASPNEAASRPPSEGDDASGHERETNPREAGESDRAVPASAVRASGEGRVWFPQATKPNVAGRISGFPVRSGLAIAAALVLAVGLWFAWRPDGSAIGPWSGETGVASPVALLGESQLGRFETRHVRCSVALSTLYRSQRYPDSLQALPAALEEKFQARLPNLDLSALGYRFERVGDCHVPGAGAVHLVYRARESEPTRSAISLWIKPYDGSPRIEAGRLFTVSREANPHPMVVWHESGLIYYLMGDWPDHVEQAARTLRGA